MTLPQLAAISSMATRHLLMELSALPQKHGLATVDMTSVGGVDAAKRLKSGTPFDLAVLDHPTLSRLADAGIVDAGTVQPLVMSQVAVAVSAGSGDGLPGPLDSLGPAFADAMGLAAAVSNSRQIAYSTGPSGGAVVSMIEALGLTDAVGDRLVQAEPGVPVAHLIETGTADIGFQQLSELIEQPGVRVLGTLPPDCAVETIFSMGVTTSSSEPRAARDVLSLWAGTGATNSKTRHGFTAP